MKKIIITTVIGLIIIPNIALAAWWNPLSWFDSWNFVFKKKEDTIILEKRIEDLEKQLKEDGKDPDTYLKKDDAIQKPISKSVESSSNIDTSITKTTPPQEITATLNKNYFNDAKLRINSLINLYQAHEIWLQNSDNQVRQAILTLSGYSYGGVYGQIRDLSIEVANETLGWISSAQINAKQNISIFDEMNLLIEKDKFISEKDFNEIPSPESVQKEIEKVKKQINNSIDEVMKTLQNH